MKARLAWLCYTINDYTEEEVFDCIKFVPPSDWYDYTKVVPIVYFEVEE